MMMPSHEDRPNDGESNEQIRSNDNDDDAKGKSSKFREVYTWVCIVLLLVNYFLAQYDKFILSYFQTPLSESLNL